MFNKTDNESKQRFGIRKLSVGVCSVLLSTLLLGMGIEENTPKANAATTDASTDSNATDVTENPQNQNTYVTANEVEFESKTDDTSSNNKTEASTDKEQKNSQSAVAQDKQDEKTAVGAETTDKTKNSDVAADKTTTVEDENSNKAESSETTVNTKNTVNSDKTEATNKENNTKTDSDKTTQDTSDQAINNANKNVAETTTDTKNAKDSNDTTNLDLENIQELLEQQAKENDGKALDAKSLTSLLRTSGVANFQVLAASTAQTEADEIKANAAITIPSTDGRYTLYISRNTWGNTTDGDQPVKVLLSGNVLAGDTVTISIPSYGIIGVNSPTIDASYGSASIKDVGNDKVVTYNFTTSGVINPVITIPADNGYGAKPQPMQITQPTVKDITWTVNGVQQTSAEFHIDVNPVWGPKFSLTKPNPDSTEQNALKKMIPNYESIYQLAINETNGVAPGQDYTNLPYASAKINAAVNYGTVITIPMPKGYVLDESATMQLNNFGDKTTITQEGNNVIITVPKGSGTQNWNSGPAYQLVGSYDIAMPSAATTYMADAPITIVQKLNDDGSQTKTWTGPTVSQDFYGANDQIPLGQMPLYSHAAYDGNQLLNNGHKQIVAYFGATNESIGSYTDYSSNFTFNFDEGLGVTELKTPTIPGTSNYKYTITYADGTTSEGQVDAGETIPGTGVITKIVVSPDDFERDQSTATNLPGNSFANQTTQSVNAFEAYGAVPDTVKPGTQLVANMTFTGAIQQGNVTRYLTSTTQFGQNVVSPDNLTSSSGIYSYQNNTATGQSNVGYLSVYSGGGQTNNIYEPIFYYVLPEWFSVYDFSTDYTKIPNFTPNTNNGVVGAPKLSLFTVPTDTSGLSRQVVKIDYSGTGYNFLAGQGANNQIRLNSLPDGANGTYQGMIYVVSPTTKLTNTAYNPDNTSNFAPSGITFNPDWVQGNTSNLYYVGANGFTINQVGGANTASVAQGNQNDILVDSGVSDLYGTNQMEYAVRLINGSGDNLTNVVALVNLPQASDTSFTFQLSGRPVYDGDKSGYTFLYSTELGDLKSNSDPDGTKPDETGYVTADQVTDWSKIKSIIIKVSSLNHAERSERLIFTGTDPNLVNDAGKTGYISTGFYSDTTKPFISSLSVYNSSTASNKVKPANITITGEAKINFQLQYTDENGQVQTVALPDLSTSYDLSKKNTMLTAQEVIELANKNAASSIPANYEIKSATLKSGGKTWQTDAPAGTPEFGGNVQYFYNGATVVLQAVPIQRTLTYQVIDENDPSNPKTIQTSTDLLSNGQAITGNQGSTVPTDATTAYEAVKSALEAKGYVISSNSSTVPATFGPDNTELTIYVTHKTTQVSNPDQWPSTSTDADKVSLSQTITRTITVAGLPTAVDGTTQTVTFTRTAIVDEVTGKVIGYVDPSDSTKTITDGDDAWTSTNNKWDAFVPSNVPAGYSIKSITDANGNYFDVTSVDGKLTGVAQTTVSPSESNVTVTITYQGNEVSNTIKFIDTDDNNKQVGETITISGRVGETDNNLNLTIPAGYELASGASLPTSYTFEATNTPITIPLVHKHKTVGPNDTWPSTSTDTDKVSLSETITRTINVSGLPTNVPSVEQKVTFTRTAIVDEVTGKVVGYVDPSDSTKTITNGADAWTNNDANWSNWTNSNVPEGYYIESAKVGNDNYTAVTTDANGIITGLNSVNVTPEMSSIAVNVVYNKVSLDLTINHATITNTYSGSEQPVSADVISEITHSATSSNRNVPVTKISDAIQNAGLTSEDYSYTDSQGKVLTGAPTTAGNYRIILNQNGLDKLNKVAGGLAINYDPSKSYVNYTIEKAQATAQLEGNNSKTYDAKSVTNVEVTKDGNIKVTANVPGTTQSAYQLQAGDYDWYSADGSTKLNGAPTNVGDYIIKLNSTGIANVKAHYGNSDNINWADDAITGSATYEITQAQATISLTDKNKQTSTWTGSEIPVNPADFVPTITTDNGVTLTVPANTLSVGDYTVTPSPVAPGTYQVSLTDSGIEKIKKAIPTSGNYTWNNTGNGVLEIVNAKADYQMSGNGETTYTGSAVELPMDQLKDAISSSNTVSGQDLVIPELDASDFTWSSGTAPTNVGDYTIKLSEDGIKKIAAANPNYDLTLGTNVFTYKINAAEASATVSGENSRTYNGQAISIGDIYNGGTITVKVTGLDNQEFTYTLQTGDYTWNVPDPTNVGTYTLTLNSTGISHLQEVLTAKYGAGNVTFANTAVSGSAKFAITPAAITISGNGRQTGTYTGNPQVVDPGNFPISLTSSDAKVPEIPTDLLTSDDFTVKDRNGNPVDPTNVGDYTVYLTPEGVEKLKKLNPNFDWPNTDQKVGTITIDKATPTVEFNASAEKTFDGTPIALGNYKTQPSVTVTAPGNPTITLSDGDYIWVKDGVVYKTAPSSVGSYTIQLTEAGKNKILQNSNNAENLDWANAKISGQGSYVITEAIATANLSGESSKTYDGNPVTTTEINSKDGTVEVTITIPNSTETVTYKLQDGDYTWNTPNGDAPSDAGSYTLSLSKTGLTNLQSAIDSKWGKGNVKITDSDLSREATFTINKANITISGDGSQTGTYTGNPQVVDPGNFPIKLTPEGDGPVPIIPEGTLTSGDFVVKGKDGSPVDPTDVGDYTVYLTPEGVDKLKKLNPNYNWPTSEQKVGTLIITPAKMDVTLSGEATKVSDGQPANVDLSTLVDNLTSANLNKDGLTLDDFSWDTPDGSAPTEVGNYTITLNENGLKKLQSNNPNYTVSVTGEFKYTITAASQKIEYVDGNGNVIKVIDNIGTDSSNYGDKVDFNVEQNVPKDYKLVDSNVPNQITIENGVTKFVVEKIENDNPIEPPTPTPDDNHETDKDDTNSDKPDLPKPDKPDKPSKPSKPSKPTKPSKPSKPNKPSVPSEHKKIREDVSPKHNGKYQKNTNETGPIKAADLNKFNKVNHAENTGTSHTGLQTNSIKDAHTLPETGSRKENLSFIAGILAMGLGLFDLGSYRRKKK